MPKLSDSILKGKLVKDGETGDGKAMFIVADSNDGYQDLRIEIDMDDCDKSHAKKWAKRIMDCVNACRGIEDLTSINPS